MKVTSRSRLNIRLQNILFVVLFLVLVGASAWLSTRYVYQSDWTASGRNTISDASIELVSRMEGPIVVEVFTSDVGPLKKHISDIIARYQRHKQDIEVRFSNPDTEPERVRLLGIAVDGEMLIEYQGRIEKIAETGEQAITNALQRLSRAGERWVVFVEGHGERSPFKQANHDLQLWGQQLEAKGIRLQGVNLATQGVIPDNTAVLVIAGPQVDYFAGEVEMVANYLRNGGNLLWLSDPDGLHGLEPIAEQLGVEFEPGVIVDPTTQQFAIDDPTFAIVGDYGIHPLTRDFNVLTIFPRAVGLRIEAQDDWQSEPVLLTTERSWSEAGELAGEIEFDDLEDVPGPLAIGVTATRPRDVEEEGAAAGDAIPRSLCFR